MGKGKVHPSPSLPAAAGAAAAAGGGGGGWDMTAEAVLMRLLPAAVLAAAAPLGADGKEVLAYLVVLASMRSSAAPTPSAKGAAHRPELGCGCFGCYTAYWSRWNGSPEADREAIHRAIEAFEEHLARKEEEEVGGAGKGRRGRKKRGSAAAAAAKEKAAKGKGKEPVIDPTPPLPLPVVLSAQEEAPKAQDEELKDELEAEQEDASTASAAGDDAVSGGEDEKRRRGWGAVLNWRSWGLWGPH